MTADVALLLEMIADEDGLDPRQKGVKPEAYTSAPRNVTAGIQSFAHKMASGYVATLLEALGEPVTMDSHLSPSFASPLIEPLTQK